ncbi:hypothetical protein [Sorangium sp. So ce341]|uniref:hypothetical protein n=1 Tax=Sorangium sp. So ce341 TaxID=3133302 RepID=UPI003F5E3D17
MKTILRLASVTIFGLLSAACIADPTWDPEGEPIDEVEEIEEAGEALVCSSIGSSVVTHSCNHTTAGPFGSVTASASQSFSTVDPNVSETHKWWTVTLPGSGSSFQGTVKFRYGFTDDYVIFLKDPNVSVTVLDSVGNTVTKTYDIAVSGCANITRAIGVTLTANATYRFTLSDTTASQQLLIERQNGCNAID